MISELDYTGVKLHFSLYYNITPFPVKWNEASRLFSFDFKNPWKYWTWYLTFFGGLGIGAIGTLTYACLLKNDQVPLFLTLCYGLVICLILFDLGMGIFILVFGDATVNCLNCLVKIQKELVRMELQEMDAVESKDQTKQSKLAFLIHLGRQRVLYILVFLVSFLPFVITALAEMININPLQFLVSDVLEIFSVKYSSLSLIPYILIRIACALVVLSWAAEGFRLFPYIVIFVMLPNLIWLNIVFLMNLLVVKNVNKTIKLMRIIHIHLKLNLVQTVATPFVSLESFCLEKTACYLIALLMFLVIRMHSIFPLQMYVVFLVVTVGLIPICFTIYLTAAKLNTGSYSNIQAWRKLITPQRKELVMKLAVLRPLGFFKGFGGCNFGPLNLEAFKELVLNTQGQTVDFLILLPVDLFE